MSVYHRAVLEETKNIHKPDLTMSKCPHCPWTFGAHNLPKIVICGRIWFLWISAYVFWQLTCSHPNNSLSWSNPIKKKCLWSRSPGLHFFLCLAGFSMQCQELCTSVVLQILWQNCINFSWSTQNFHRKIVTKKIWNRAVSISQNCLPWQFYMNGFLFIAKLAL
jgi:hypothetical protein